MSALPLQQLAMDEPVQFTSLSLTNVQYNPSDRLSYISAWLALAPQALCIMYVTLIWASREAEITLMFAGQMGCEVLNWSLKRLIREERPRRGVVGKGYGMPSSHSQFVAFFSLYLTLFLLLRHQTGSVTSSSPSTFAERLGLSLLALVCALSVAASRVYLNYHTPRQVWVGFAVGLFCAVAWFLATTYLRKAGWLEWALETPLARRLRFRDLLLTEDLQDAGWEQFQQRRLKKRTLRASGALPTSKSNAKKAK
ncbi:hypothetical protein DV736_g2641, partial [Chaetothyriales sp. CBS 134916]